MKGAPKPEPKNSTNHTVSFARLWISNGRFCTYKLLHNNLLHNN